ncbi:type VII secretion protein EccB [Corynebacterium caspium]|uniref:type VII secretion protein EccB n=1 Tax=Corynebacterium caspium TaxID=234828 RepID=UPI0003742655|nr:type VII secretion protein EccB [Corynebacterium caspium]WKD59812.1 ESX-1 secretion system protein eccB1 [Corynebacterium caspium DSM 44850]
MLSKNGVEQAKVSSTTKAQVTGHKFLVRRMHHGLVLGDIRMIYDPLARRHRAAIMGVVAAVVMSLGMGLMAFLNPDPSPGDAVIWRSAGGQLYVRYGQRMHPVTNIASARLIAGEPAQPVSVGDSALAQVALGELLGLWDAPVDIASPKKLGLKTKEIPIDNQGPAVFAACTSNLDSGAVTVVLDNEPLVSLGRADALLLRSPQSKPQDFILDARSLRALPPADSVEGRVIRRELGITATTPVWHPRMEIFAVMKQESAYRVPELEAGEVVQAGDISRAWWRTPTTASFGAQAQPESSQLTAVTPLQLSILLALGARKAAVVSPADMAVIPDSGIELQLPTRLLRFLDPEKQPICVDGITGKAGFRAAGPAATRGPIGMPSTPDAKNTSVSVLNAEDTLTGVDISGLSPAAKFIAPGLSAGLAVDIGHGVGIITPTGRYYPIASAEDAAALGINKPIPAPWSVLSLLPQAEVLAREKALKAAVT